MNYFAGAITLTDSDGLAIFFMLAGGLLALPVTTGMLIATWHKNAKYRNAFLVSCAIFVANVAVFGLLSGFLRRFTEENLINKSETIYVSMLGVMLIASLGIIISSLLLVLGRMKAQKDSFNKLSTWI